MSLLYQLRVPSPQQPFCSLNEQNNNNLGGCSRIAIVYIKFNLGIPSYQGRFVDRRVINAYRLSNPLPIKSNLEE